jgi:hypothetical protein
LCAFLRLESGVIRSFRKVIQQMSTPAQIAANTANAQSSTGPRSETGKATSSKNGIREGLFTTNDFVRPAHQPAYDELNAELQSDLAPVGILERNLVDEIRGAMWRLRRCGEVEANLVATLGDDQLDPMETENARAEKTQRSVDRARAQAHRLLHKCTAELRRLQTERQYAKEFFFDGADITDIGIADWRAVTKAHGQRTIVELRQKKLDRLDNILNISQRCAGEVSTLCTDTMQTQSEAKQAA